MDLTTDEKDKRRKAIIEGVCLALENMGVNALLLGNDDDKHKYADAILGVMSEPRPAVVYDSSKVIEAIMEMNGWGYEMASDWYGCNTIRAVRYRRKDDNPPVLVDPIEI